MLKQIIKIIISWLGEVGYKLINFKTMQQQQRKKQLSLTVLRTENTRVKCNTCAQHLKNAINTTWTHLRLRDRGRRAGEWRPSSSVMLSVLKCFVRKWSSSAVGWKGSWCSFSWDEHDDWVQKKIQKRNALNACIGSANEWKRNGFCQTLHTPAEKKATYQTRCLFLTFSVG